MKKHQQHEPSLRKECQSDWEHPSTQVSGGSHIGASTETRKKESDEPPSVGHKKEKAKRRTADTHERQGHNSDSSVKTMK